MRISSFSRREYTLNSNR